MSAAVVLQHPPTYLAPNEIQSDTYCTNGIQASLLVYLNITKNQGIIDLEYVSRGLIEV